MADITVSDTLLTKMATFVQSATPELEKFSAEKQAFASEAPGMVDAMITAGVLPENSRDVAIKNLAEGGLAKAAELIPWLASRVTAPAMGKPTVEKQASYGSRDKNASKESDRIWVEGMMS